MHLILHFIVPLAISFLCFRKHWAKVYLVMMLTMAVDLDHLLATPIYDPSRCSIGFHPLHQWPAVVIYSIACAIPKVRWVGLGLIIHMALDSIDCQMTNGVWFI